MGEEGGAAGRALSVARPVLVLVTLALVAGSGAAGWLHGSVWGGILLLTAGVTFGLTAGLALPSHWSGPVAEAVTGEGGAFLLFVAAAWFTGAQAYAVGRAVAEGGPLAGAALVLAPAAVAAYALRRASS